MIFEQYYQQSLAHASYLVGDPEARVAAVVDPQRDVDDYVADARRLGVEIRHVFLTHFHADFVAGHLELRARTGADIRMGARAKPDFPCVPMREGDELTLGRVLLRVLETPGHTPEMISILVFDTARAPDRPHAVLTGDTLFVGDVGRPDLLASSGLSAEELAGMLYDSIHRKLLALPDETLVCPAHGPGSLCGRSLGPETISTIGVQRKTNYALQPMSREEFIRLVTADQPEAPAYFAHASRLNTRERPAIDEVVARASVGRSLDEVLGLTREGTLLLDVRDPPAFAAGHLAGSINIGLGGKFETW